MQLPNPQNLQELVSILHQELKNGGLDSASVDVDRVSQIMENYSSNQSDWLQFALFDKGRYTRNLVDDGNGQFNLMVLCWPENSKR